MGMLDANQCRSGTKLLMDGQLYTVIERRHHKPGKGGALVRVPTAWNHRGRVGFPRHDHARLHSSGEE